MKKSSDLKQLRASKIDAQRNLVEAAKTATREMNTDEVTRFDALQSEIEALDVEIERAIKWEKSQAERAAANGEVISGPTVEAGEKKERFNLLKALRTLASGKALSGVELDVHNKTVAEMRAQGLAIPDGQVISLPMQNRLQSVTGDSGTKGGALVGSTPMLVQPLQPTMRLEELGVNVMSGLVGDVPLPTSGAFSFGYVAENADVSGTDVTFSGPILKPKRCVGVVDISKKLIAQSSFDIEAYITQQINIAYGNAVMQAAISGAGGNAPTGLLDLITTNINTTAGAGTYATVTALEGLIDDASATSVSRAYLSGTKLRTALKNVKIDAGSGIFLTNGLEMNSYKYLSTVLMPILDIDKHPLIFGDWAQMTVGYWGGISIIVDPYTQAAKGAVRLIIEGYSDVAVANEKAFAVNKVMTLA